jgi:DNA helicase-2/ATP-dependent DNA helicase PcrA
LKITQMMLTLYELWAKAEFKPNSQQEEAIRHIDGPLFLTAGPGSGKTRVLLWRTLNLIVFNDVDPKDIFLSTFTEKAARQLKSGLAALLGFASNYTNRPYDISRMYVGTVHSNCQSIIGDRRFSADGTRSRVPIVMDELGQYFHLYNRAFWIEMLAAAGMPTQEDGLEAHRIISQYFAGRGFGSRHGAVMEVKAFFNRLSEEDIDPNEVTTRNPTLQALLKMYDYYLQNLSNGPIKSVDLSLLQQTAYRSIESCKHADKEFKHLIIDEYQDTNTIQEKIFFRLAKGHKNICVVGDDDQALYRFRGATVENLVEFENRCLHFIGKKPRRIDLDTNYRSRNQIVDFYTNFISQIDWKKSSPQRGAYRVIDKAIKANNKDNKPSVLVSAHDRAENVYAEIAAFVKKLKDSGKIQDFNQCAFLFPAMKNNTRVDGFKRAFETLNIPVYAPRAGNFFDVDEIKAMMGCILQIFDRPHYGGEVSKGIGEYRNWMIGCMQTASNLITNDPLLRQFIQDKKSEIAALKDDYEKMMTVAHRKKWDIVLPATDEMVRAMVASSASRKATQNITSGYFLSLLRRRREESRPVTLEYVINRATSLDWSVLDLFYQFCSFNHFRDMFGLAEGGEDEGFVCNLALLSGYLGRFLEEKSPIITAALLHEQKFSLSFFGSFFYALYRLGQSEYEDEEVPFPKGRIPFLTIHQSKGLEFPVVVLGSVYRTIRSTDIKEEIIRDLTKKEGEPLDRIPEFDLMRMYYVGLSRAKNLLVLPRFTHNRNANDVFKQLIFNENYTEVSQFKLSTLPVENISDLDLGKTYSYTADYLNYLRCPRQYMLFRKFGFVTSRSQNQYFGTLVHQTIEDLHHLLKQNKQVI